MPYAALPAIAEDLDLLQEQLRLERQAERKRRLHLLVLIKSGQVNSKKDAAEHLVVHRNTITRWLQHYQQGGLDQLLAIEQRGPKPGQRTVSKAVLEAIETQLDSSVGFSGYDELQQWINTEFGLTVPYKSVYNLVRYHLGAKLKVPRPEHPKKV